MSTNDLTIEQKINNIENTNDFGEIRQAWFPPAASDSYYFISYCHKDYKKVFKDIYGMQEHDASIAVWYDRELNAGKDWRIEAKRHIYDFNCKGILFYVSENSVESDAVFGEMKMALDSGKQFIPIVLPAMSIRDREGDYICGAELLQILCPRLNRDNEKFKLYNEMFGKDVIFLKDTDEIQYKIDRIKNALVGQPLLDITIGQDDVVEFDGLLFVLDAFVTVNAVNDINITEIKAESFKTTVDEQSGRIDYANCIGVCAFANCRQLEKIELPDNIQKVGDYAFSKCNSLVKINIPSCLDEICDGVFFRCVSIENVTIPSGVERIGEWAFCGCSSLKNIIIPESVKIIDGWAFSECSALTNIQMPDNVKNINKGVFNECTSLTNIKIPNGVENIGERAFYNCSSLANIKIPDSVKSIGEYAFFKCSSLNSITLPGYLRSVDNGVFYKCSALTNVIVPRSVESIGEWAFFGCSALKSIIIPDSAKDIGERAFSECSMLTNIKISKSVKNIGGLAFYMCLSLSDIIYEGTMAQWYKVKKSKNWDIGTGSYVIHCTDGDIKKGE